MTPTLPNGHFAQDERIGASFWAWFRPGSIAPTHEILRCEEAGCVDGWVTRWPKRGERYERDRRYRCESVCVDGFIESLLCHNCEADLDLDVGPAVIVRATVNQKFIGLLVLHRYWYALCEECGINEWGDAESVAVAAPHTHNSAEFVLPRSSRFNGIPA